MQQDNNNRSTNDDDSRSPQPFRDVVFTVLFVLHLGLFALVTSVYGKFIYEMDGDINNGVYITLDFRGLVYTLSACTACAVFLCVHTIGVLTKFPKCLIQGALLFSTTASLAALCAFFKYNLTMLMVMGSICSIILGSLTYRYWDEKEINFCVSYLKIALYSVKSNLALFTVAAISLLVSFLWSLCWSVAAVGVANIIMRCKDGICEGEYHDVFVSTNLYVVIGLCLSFLWTQGVIKNIVHVTVAGAVGAWWFEFEESKKLLTWNSKNVKKSASLACTKLLGSICVGTMIISVVKCLKYITDFFRQSRYKFLQWFQECFVDCFGGLFDYINDWNYIYVGLFGTGYIESGQSVLKLFNTCGWSSIITDNLVVNCLFMVNAVVGFIYMDRTTAATVGFGIGLINGFIVSNVLLSVIRSAASTAIVCYAEAPIEFEVHHAELSKSIKDSLPKADFKRKITVSDISDDDEKGEIEVDFYYNRFEDLETGNKK